MKTITREQAKNYGKYAATAVVGIGVGLAGYTVNDTPTQKTDAYQNLNQTLQDAQSDNADLEDQISDLETTVTEKEDRVANLESQVTQFNQTVEDLRAENADLEDAVAQAQERVGLVDYLPVFSDEDVELQDPISVSLDQEAEELDAISNSDYDYDELDVNYDSDDGFYHVTIQQFESVDDAEERVDEFEEAQDPVTISRDGDEHTVEVTDYEGEMKQLDIEYDDAEAIEDVNDVDDIQDLTVDGVDITDRVESVSYAGNNDEQLRITLSSEYQVDEGDTVSVTYRDAKDDGDLEEVAVDNGDEWTYFQYDEDDNTENNIYRDGDTVVEVEGTDNGDEFDAQYADLTSQYE